MHQPKLADNEDRIRTKPRKGKKARQVPQIQVGFFSEHEFCWACTETGEFSLMREVMDARPFELSLREDGAALVPGAAHGIFNQLVAALPESTDARAGVRITGGYLLRSHLSSDGVIGAIAAKILGDGSRAVRAVFFDKTARTNWSLGWHQDRTICVKERFEVDGFGPWTCKSGVVHVEPPFEILAKMVTLRVHLDDVPKTNAPLMIAPGSHLQGRVPVNRIQSVVEICGVKNCLARAGDVWVYSTPILHASQSARIPSRRRVLQVDFSAEALPSELEWLGV